MWPHCRAEVSLFVSDVSHELRAPVANLKLYVELLEHDKPEKLADYITNLQVGDTGLGIPPHDVPHLFERFYRGQNVGQAGIPGTGLGLAIVKEIIDTHQGRIEVESRVGEGTTFQVCLPAAKLKDSF